MADTDQGTLSNETPENDEVLSPSIDNDTQDSGSGSDSARGTDDEKVRLQARIDELEKRVSHGSRTTAELRQAQQVLAAINERERRWRAANVDPDEIDRAIAAASGQTQGGQGTGAPPVTRQEIAQHTENTVQLRLYLDRWEDAKDAYFERDKDLDTPATRRWFDSNAWGLAQQEIEEYGRVVSTPKKLFQATKDAFNRHVVAVAEKRAGKKQSEERISVRGQGVTETSHVKPKTDRDSDERNLDPGSKEYFDQYVGGQRAAFDRTRSNQRPSKER